MLGVNFGLISKRGFILIVGVHSWWIQSAFNAYRRQSIQSPAEYSSCCDHTIIRVHRRTHNRRKTLANFSIGRSLYVLRVLVGLEFFSHAITCPAVFTVELADVNNNIITDCVKIENGESCGARERRVEWFVIIILLCYCVRIRKEHDYGRTT